MAELFSRAAVNFGGAFTADKGIVVSQNGLTGTLMTNLQMQYAQRVQRVYELGIAGVTSNMYYVVGHAEGTLSPMHTIGPAVSLSAYFQNYSDPCRARNNTLKLSTRSNSCDQNGNLGGIDYSLKFCLLVQVGFATAAENLLINQGSSLMFSGLEYAETAGIFGAVPVGSNTLSAAA